MRLSSKHYESNQRPVAVDIQYLQCPISTIKLVNPLIAPDGTTYSETEIVSWLKVKQTSPATGVPLNREQLRKNFLVEDLLKKAKPISLVMDGGKKSEFLLIDRDLLINPQTGRFYNNPVVNEQGITVDGDRDSDANSDGDDHGHGGKDSDSNSASDSKNKYRNLIIANLIENLVKTEEEEEIQLADGESKISRDEKKSLPTAAQRQQDQQALPEGEVLVGPEEMLLNYGVSNLNEPLLRQAEIDVPPSPAILRAPVVATPIQNRDLIAARLRSLVHRECLYRNCMQYLVGPLLGCGIIIGIVALIKYFKNGDDNCVEPEKPVTWKVKVPWSTGGEFCFINHEQNPLYVGEYQFTLPVNIKDTARDIWGYLIQGGRVTKTYQPGAGYSYLVTPPSEIAIEPGQEACATYNYDPKTSEGPLKSVGMIMPSLGYDVWLNGETVPADGLCVCCKDPAPGYDLGGWFTNWSMYQRNFTANSLPIRLLNNIYYAFLGFNSTSGELLSTDPNADNIQLPQLAMQRRQYPSYLKTSLGIGGYCTGSKFNELTANPVAVDRFITDISGAVKQLQTDGVNIDWEWWGDGPCNTPPNPNQFSYLFQSLRKQLGSNTRIDVALPAGKNAIANIPEATWCDVFRNTDRKMIMTYDLNGGWSGLSNYQASLYMDPRDPTFHNPALNQLSIDGATQFYRNMSCYKPSEFMIGAPAYGRAVTVTNTELPAELPMHGLWQTITGVPDGQFDKSGTFDYRCIQLRSCFSGNQLPKDLTLIPTKNNTYGNYTQQPWAFSSSSNIVVSFDDPGAIKAKTCYAVNNGMKGIMVWDLSQDAPSDSEMSLVKAAQTQFSQKDVTCHQAEKHQSTLFATSTTPSSISPVSSASSVSSASLTTSTSSTSSTSIVSSPAPDFYEAMSNVAIQSFVCAFVLKFLGDLLSIQLEKKEYSQKHILCCNLLLRVAVSTYFGSGFVGAASMSIVPLLKHSGVFESIGISKTNAARIHGTLESITTAVTVVNTLISLATCPWGNMAITMGLGSMCSGLAMMTASLALQGYSQIAKSQVFTGSMPC